MLFRSNYAFVVVWGLQPFQIGKIISIKPTHKTIEKCR